MVEDGGEGEAGHGGPVPRLGVAPLTAVRSLLIDHQVAKVTANSLHDSLVTRMKRFCRS